MGHRGRRPSRGERPELNRPCGDGYDDRVRHPHHDGYRGRTYSSEHRHSTGIPFCMFAYIVVESCIKYSKIWSFVFVVMAIENCVEKMAGGHTKEGSFCLNMQYGR